MKCSRITYDIHVKPRLPLGGEAPPQAVMGGSRRSVSEDD